jgi:hypothetical protein
MIFAVVESNSRFNDIDLFLPRRILCGEQDDNTILFHFLGGGHGDPPLQVISTKSFFSHPENRQI